MDWFLRLCGLIGRRYWIRRIDRVLSRAYEHGMLGSYELHALDHRLKYEPTKRFDGWVEQRNRYRSARAALEPKP